MNENEARACPHCGSHQLVANRSSRRVYLTHGGERIPLLTVNYSLEHPVIEEVGTVYTCTCSWTGSESDLRPHG